MAAERPFALHITWTTYGTWLPGDERGYVTHTLHSPGDWSKRENTPGTEYAKNHHRTYAIAKKLMKHEEVLLDRSLATIAAVELIHACQLRGWRIARAAIMANHLHVLLFDSPADGSAVRRILKGTTQAALTRHEGTPQRWWTAGGSDRYKNDDQAIESAIRYIEQQDRILVAIQDGLIVDSWGVKPPGEATPPG